MPKNVRTENAESYGTKSGVATGAGDGGAILTCKNSSKKIKISRKKMFFTKNKNKTSISITKFPNI